LCRDGCGECAVAIAEQDADSGIAVAVIRENDVLLAVAIDVSGENGRDAMAVRGVVAGFMECAIAAAEENFDAAIRPDGQVRVSAVCELSRCEILR
jgi:hypothetical protein